MQEILEKITAFAANAHGDQQRKYTPEPYIAHPVRVMNSCKRFTSELSVLAAALLHDVLEDTTVSPTALYDFLLTVMSREDSTYTLSLVTELTDIYTKAARPRMNRRSRKNKEAERLSKSSAAAQTVKYADIIDNARAMAVQDPDFGLVYLRECKQLLTVMHDGEPELREEAFRIVNDELASLGGINP